MPWTMQSALKHTRKATTPKKQKQWSNVANSMLASGKSEVSAIRAANAALKGHKGKQGKQGKQGMRVQKRERLHQAE